MSQISYQADAMQPDNPLGRKCIKLFLFFVFLISHSVLKLFLFFVFLTSHSLRRSHVSILTTDSDRVDLKKKIDLYINCNTQKQKVGTNNNIIRMGSCAYGLLSSLQVTRGWNIDRDLSLHSTAIACGVTGKTPRGGIPRTQKLRYPLVVAQGCIKFSLSKPGVGQNIALHAVPADRTSTTQFLPQSRFTQLHVCALI